MKKYIFIILVIAISSGGCKKDQQDDWFYIEIISPSNFDCKVPEVVFLNRKQEAYQIIGDSRGVYVATGLPKVLYPAGTKMYVTIQKPNTDQLLLCTNQGSSYPQVFVTSVK